MARLLEGKGWQLMRVKGSHHVYGKTGMTTRISLPIHGSRSLKSGLQRYFMKLAQLKEEDL